MPATMKYVSMYTINGRSCEFEFSAYESQVLSRLREPFPGKFLPRRLGQSVTVSRTELLAALDQFLGRLEREGEMLAYHYSITTKGRAGGEYSGSGGISCNFKGAKAVAESGPGYCRIKAVGGGPSPVPGLPVSDVVLADLRDMLPLTTDDGVELAAQREHRPIELEGHARDLAIFLHCQDGAEVEVKLLGEE